MSSSTDMPTGTVRLQKVLAAAGIASRRAAEALIAAGRVTVNGHVVTRLGTLVDPRHDRVLVDGQAVDRPAPRHYILMHKPRGVLCTASDPEGRPTVFDLLRGQYPRLFSVGRLDYDSSGALLLTNDGDLAARLLHPGRTVSKQYHVKVDRELRPDELRAWQQGIVLADGPTQPARVRRLSARGGHAWYELRIHEGRNRQIRRMCEALGARALKVYRVAFAGLSVDALKPGDYRPLHDLEVDQLRVQAGLRPSGALGRPGPRGPAPAGAGRRYDGERRGPERPRPDRGPGERPAGAGRRYDGERRGPERPRPERPRPERPRPDGAPGERAPREHQRPDRRGPATSPLRPRPSRPGGAPGRRPPRP